MRLKPIKLFIVLFIFLNVIIIYNSYLSKNRIESYFRIHVVANSNSIDDQLLKYNIAKRVDEFLSSLTISSKKEAQKIITDNIQNILNICEQAQKELRLFI